MTSGKLVGGCMLALGGVWLVGAPPSRGAGPFSFPHQPHLSDATVEAGLRAALAVQRGEPLAGQGGNVDAECVVCHDFAKGDAAHLSGCLQCHVGDTYLEVGRSGREPYSGRRAFPHAKHLESGELSCFSCHTTRVEFDWVEFSVPAPALGPRGSGGRPGGGFGEATCADCHAEHVAQGGKVKQYERTGDGRACAECHLGADRVMPLAYRPGERRGGVRPFLHADHGGAAANCDDCHGDIRQSQSIWDYDPTLATTEKCVACHVADAAGAPLVGLSDPVRETRVPFVAFSKFPHEKHLAPSDEIETSGKVTAGCRTCHYPETDADASTLFPGRAPATREPVSRAELVDYRACAPCHEAWRCENHGVGAWACFKCHAGEATPDGRLPMARASVARADLETVGFTAVHHPGVTTTGGELADASQPDDKTCADCHPGTEVALPSRLTDRDFAHAPHVPRTPGNDDCLACHASTATTSWSEDLARFETHVDGAPPPTGARPAARGCLDCHAGATEEQLGVTTAERSVPQFDHKAHVTAQSYRGTLGPIPCIECHDPGGEVGYAVPEDVADCTRCHGHDASFPDKLEITGPSSSEGAAQSCKHCHEEVWPEGAQPVRETRTRPHLDLLPGTQWHDTSGDCAVCHERDGFDGSAPDYAERITTARVRQSIHDDPALAGEWFNDPRIDQEGGDAEGRTCRTCHRREPRRYLRGLEER